MTTTSRTEALFTATLSAALLALGVTAFATAERPTAAEPALQATLPAVLVVGQRAVPVADAARVETVTVRKAS